MQFPDMKIGPLHQFLTRPRADGSLETGYVMREGAGHLTTARQKVLDDARDERNSVAFERIVREAVKGVIQRRRAEGKAVYAHEEEDEQGPSKSVSVGPLRR